MTPEQDFVPAGWNAATCGSSFPSYETPPSRSFWKAGSYHPAGGAAASRSPEQDPEEPSALSRARVHPKFLHSNATSHRWAFGAVAELVDNAVDEIPRRATFVKLDRLRNPRNGSDALLFLDDGGGMDPAGLRRCMSLGFSAKPAGGGTTSIGQYGNGFKTSTMRLGADVVVFTRSGSDVGGGSATTTQSVGLLSYTFLTRTQKDDIVVPVVDFQVTAGEVSAPLTGAASPADWKENLQTILDWSPFSSQEALMEQFAEIGSRGTKVLVFNLWLDDDGLPELDFGEEDDDDDIKLRRELSTPAANSSKIKTEIINSHISHTFRFSLRAYLSILYLREFSTFSIFLRGRPVRQLRITDELNLPAVPSVEMTIGFAKEAPLLGMYGVNVYHRNRLVLPFWKLFHDGSSKGRCVIGVVEADFMAPAHDKQDFERSPVFFRLEGRLKQAIAEFWRSHCHLLGYQSGLQSVASDGGSSGEDRTPADSGAEDSLFVRRTELRRREEELKKTINQLEAELALTRQESSRLSSDIESATSDSSML
ncbi:unnamed protein product [Spirodela intermedia]|uniref:Morc S5 domain-containing protein n=1 Tax=Spirodela intermedia TaxID=51605 RepID=A0A7I8I8A8_SPIIN|nr:unnamed protein product [Spirodela intermedia]CAA6653897.1 unnamed protein product [Spirodela intermedia]